MGSSASRVALEIRRERVQALTTAPGSSANRARRALGKASRSLRQEQTYMLVCMRKTKAGAPSYTPTHTHTGLITAATSPLPAGDGGSPELIPLLIL
jgi:hypothetical protein